MKNHINTKIHIENRKISKNEYHHEKERDRKWWLAARRGYKTQKRIQKRYLNGEKNIENLPKCYGMGVGGWSIDRSIVHVRRGRAA